MPHFGGVLPIGIHGLAAETQASLWRADLDEIIDRVWIDRSIPGRASSGGPHLERRSHLQSRVLWRSGHDSLVFLF